MECSPVDCCLPLHSSLHPALHQVECECDPNPSLQNDPEFESGSTPNGLRRLSDGDGTTQWPPRMCIVFPSIIAVAMSPPHGSWCSGLWRVHCAATLLHILALFACARQIKRVQIFKVLTCPVSQSFVVAFSHSGMKNVSYQESEFNPKMPPITRR